MSRTVSRVWSGPLFLGGELDLLVSLGDGEQVGRLCALSDVLELADTAARKFLANGHSKLAVKPEHCSHGLALLAG